MIWKHIITDKQTEPGIHTLRVLFSNDTDGKALDKTFQAATLDGCLSQIFAFEDSLNSFDPSALDAVKIGQPVARPVPVVPDPPTADQLARQSFLDLTQQYRNVQAQIKAGVGKMGQSDLDAIAIQIKDTFVDAYAPFIVGLF